MTMVLATPPWQVDAPCRSGDPRWWYPPDYASDPKYWYEQGRTVCLHCPVWEACRDAGEREKFGMWGGLTPRERANKRTWPHGVWIRYRQGCGCRPCSQAHAEALAR